MIRQPIMYIMVGLPRSGKSTYARKNLRGIPIVSADQLRLLVYGQRFWQAGEPLMWNIHDLFLQALLDQRLDVVIDKTSITKKQRQKLYDLADKNAYLTCVVALSTSKEECISRARATDQPDLIPVIERMYEQMEWPNLELEDCDYVTEVM